MKIFVCFYSTSFGQSEVFLKTKEDALHMELDQFTDGENILFSTWGKVQLASNGSVTLVAAIPKCWIPGFKQLNSTHLVIVAYSLHCLTMFSRAERRMHALAGICSTKGNLDGKRGTLNLPHSIERDISNPNRLFVTDVGNFALRSVNLKTGVLGTIIPYLRTPRTIIWMNNRLLLSHHYFISYVDFLKNGSATLTKAVGSTAADLVNGDFKEAKFMSAAGMAKLADGVYLVADTVAKKLRVLDFDSQLVKNLCFNGSCPCVNGSDIEYPRAILKVNTDLYVAGKHKIYKLKGWLNIHFKLCSLLQNGDWAEFSF